MLVAILLILAKIPNISCLVDTFLQCVDPQICYHCPPLWSKTTEERVDIHSILLYKKATSSSWSLSIFCDTILPFPNVARCSSSVLFNWQVLKAHVVHSESSHTAGSDFLLKDT